MNSVKVKIGNKDYNLNGDRDLILKSAEEVNKHWNLLQSSSNGLSNDNLPLLTALNIAESKITEVDSLRSEISVLKMQLIEMNKKLSSVLN